MYHSFYGRILGHDGTNLLYRSRPVGAMPQAYGRGKTFYVDSQIDHADGESPETAMGTLDEAFAKCTANQGDVIVVMPNHAETVTGVAGIAHDIAGVSVIGLGIGKQRPRFLMDAATTVTYAITADDAYIENLTFASGHASVVTCFTTTKKGSHFNNIWFENNTTNENFLTCIKATSTTDNDSDDLVVENCRWVTSDADDLEFIEINANLAGGIIKNNVVITAGTASPLILVAAGKILTGVEIAWNKLSNAATANELFFSNDGSTNTGIAHNNYCAHLDTTTTHDLGLESSGITIFNLYSTSTIALQGGVIPAADVNN